LIIHYPNLSSCRGLRNTIRINGAPWRSFVWVAPPRHLFTWYQRQPRHHPRSGAIYTAGSSPFPRIPLRLCNLPRRPYSPFNPPRNSPHRSPPSAVRVSSLPRKGTFLQRNFLGNSCRRISIYQNRVSDQSTQSCLPSATTRSMSGPNSRHVSPISLKHTANRPSETRHAVSHHQRCPPRRIRQGQENRRPQHSQEKCIPNLRNHPQQHPPWHRLRA